MVNWIDRLVLNNCASGNRIEIIAVLPIPGRSDRPGRESTPAIRTDIAKDLLDALRTEGAFEGANTCLNGIWRQ